MKWFHKNPNKKDSNEGKNLAWTCFILVENITDIKPGGFINITWNDKELMLPFSPRVGFVSFSDKKWDFRYNLIDSQKINEEEPLLYELLPNGNYITHECILKN